MRSGEEKEQALELQFEQELAEQFEKEDGVALPEGLRAGALKKKLTEIPQEEVAEMKQAQKGNAITRFIAKYPMRAAGIAAAFFLVFGLGVKAYTGIYGKTLADRQIAEADQTRETLAETDDAGSVVEQAASDNESGASEATSATRQQTAEIEFAAAAYDLPDGIVVKPDYQSIAAYCEEQELLVRTSSYFGEKEGLSDAENGAVMEAARDEAGGAAADLTASADDAGYSGTNVRTEGIDEADIVKTDGKYIYRVTNDNGVVVRVFAADQGKVSHVDDYVVAENEISANMDNGWTYGSDDRSYYASNLLIVQDRLIVIGTENSFGYDIRNVIDSKESAEDVRIDDIWNNTTNTVIWTLDISDPAHVRTVSQHTQDGFFHSAKLQDGMVYIFSSAYANPIWVAQETYDTSDDALAAPAARVEDYTKMMELTDYENIVPKADGAPIVADHVFLPKESDTMSYIVVSALDPREAEQLQNSYAIMSQMMDTYVSGGHIYLWEYQYTYDEQSYRMTDEGIFLMKYDYGSGALAPEATAEVKGTLNNEFSIDEYGGNLRIVTTVREFSEHDDFSSDYINMLYVMDEKLNVVGSIQDIAPGELIKSARFFGDVGYFVTFRQTDPLFSVDLSDPTNPQIIGELKIPGFSEYLHPYGDGLLLGFGQDADISEGGTTGLKLSMFDISDPADVRELVKYKVLENKSRYDYSYSDAEYDHHAILADADKNVIGFYFNGSQASVNDTGYVDYIDYMKYVVYSYDPAAQGFVERFSYDFGDVWQSEVRGLYIGDYYYIIGYDRIVAFDLTGGAMTEELKLTTSDGTVYGGGNGMMILD